MTALLLVAACACTHHASAWASGVGVLPGPSDPNATAQTRGLFARLALLSSAPTLRMAFGQQRANEEGMGWTDLSGAANRSDILTDTGDWPAVFGFNFGSLTDPPKLNPDGDATATATATPNVLAAARRAAAVGGIVAAHFPTSNPLGCTHDPKYATAMGTLDGRGGCLWCACVRAARARVAPAPARVHVPGHMGVARTSWALVD